MKIITIESLREIITHIGLETFYCQLIKHLETDFSHWHNFYKSPRHATYFPHGVIELMPCANDSYYSFKYVNGHPLNTASGKLCVAAFGVLSEVSSGYPLMLSEMTLLTALRTSATGALAAKYLARKDSRHLAIIGTGAQSEFQIMAFKQLFPLEQISFFDIDAQAMNKFAQNLGDEKLLLSPCTSVELAVSHADIIVTATAAKKQTVLFNKNIVKPGTHIHAMGGDCPGKTEFDLDMISSVKLVVEYMPQSLEEGEVQQANASSVYAELWEIINGNKAGRENAQEVTFFDSVGFALEDFSILKLIYQLSVEMQLGDELSLIPDLNDPKDLYSLLNPENR